MPVLPGGMPLSRHEQLSEVPGTAPVGCRGRRNFATR